MLRGRTASACLALCLCLAAPIVLLAQAKPAPAASPGASPSASATAGSSPSPSPAASPSPTASPAASASPAPGASPGPATVRSHYREQDIKLASEAELRVMARQAGLLDTGSAEELRQRLRDHWARIDAGQASLGESAGAVIGASPSPSPSPSPVAGGDKSLEVTIESAGSADYFTVEEVDENYLRLSGGVVLLVKDSAKNSTHYIRASRIMYNRKQDTMIAHGDVYYRLNENGKDQEFAGTEMRFSLKNREVFFLDGVLYNKQSSGGGQNYRVEGEEISRFSSSLTVLDAATVSSSKAVPPSYRVTAGHIWLLQSGEWAIRDGVLHVGRVPMMYFPFFYYPSDELIFHPVAGYQDPEGAFLQTTTYLYGQKPKSPAPLSFMQLDTGGGETVIRQHGLWEERIAKAPGATPNPSPSTGPTATPNPTASPNPSPSPGPTAAPSPSPPAPSGPVAGDYLKLLVDAYSRYGFLGGFQGKFTAPPALSLEFMALAGFSRALYKNAEGYTTYYTAEAGGQAREYWESGSLFGQTLPLRFLVSAQLNLSASGYKLGFSLPLASDPSFRADFLANRKEDMDWAKLLGISKTAAATGGSGGADTMAMSLTNSFTPDLGALKPFLDSFNLSNLDATISWTAKDWASPDEAVSKAVRSSSKKYWVPSLLTLPQMNLSLSGTLLQFPFNRPAPVGLPVAGRDPAAKAAPAFLFPETEPEAPKQETEEKSAEAAPQPSPEPQGPAMDYLVVDGLSAAASALKTSDWEFSLAYAATPGMTVTSRFAAADATAPDDFGDEQNYWAAQGRVSGSLSLSISTPFKFFGVVNKISYAAQDQSLLYLDAAAPPVIASNIKLESLQARYQTLDNSAVFTVLPFSGIPGLEGSSLNYRMSAILFRERYKSGTEPANAVYATETADWTKDLITAHSAGGVLKLNLPPFQTSLDLSYTLPPRDQSIVGRFNIGFDRLSLNADETVNIDRDSGIVKPSPLNVNLALPVFDWMDLSQSASFDLEKLLINNYGATLGLFGFKANLAARRAKDQVFDRATNTWQSRGEESFRVVSAYLDYALKINPDPFWHNRLSTSFTLDGRWTQDFMQFTDSSLSWNLGWTFKVAEFLDLTASLGGRNARLFRYFPAYNEILGLEDKDLLSDFLASFNFADERARQGSYFKMSSLSLNAVHYLGDWNLTATYTAQPAVQVVDNRQSLVWNYQLKVFIAWAPIPEIKSTINASKDPSTASDVIKIE